MWSSAKGVEEVGLGVDILVSLILEEGEPKRNDRSLAARVFQHTSSYENLNPRKTADDDLQGLSMRQVLHIRIVDIGYKG